ncbi:hypothetical protein KIPB_013974, partial [Kipferlia bialata]|eukprot:g13974.t1
MAYWGDNPDTYDLVELRTLPSRSYAHSLIPIDADSVLVFCLGEGSFIGSLIHAPDWVYVHKWLSSSARSDPTLWNHNWVRVFIRDGGIVRIRGCICIFPSAVYAEREAFGVVHVIDIATKECTSLVPSPACHDEAGGVVELVEGEPGVDYPGSLPVGWCEAGDVLLLVTRVTSGNPRRSWTIKHRYRLWSFDPEERTFSHVIDSPIHSCAEYRPDWVVCVDGTVYIHVGPGNRRMSSEPRWLIYVSPFGEWRQESLVEVGGEARLLQVVGRSIMYLCGHVVYRYDTIT